MTIPPEDVPATRVDPSFGDVPATRRDPPIGAVPATRRDPPPGAAETRRDGPRPAVAAWGLPESLAAEYSFVRHVETAGAEADLMVVADARGEEFVVKLYRPGFRADRRVWSRVREMRTTHIVRILRTGDDGGRDFELQEFVPGGTMADLLADKAPWPADLVAEAVRQLAEALAALHEHDIVHRDLKPANVLVRASRPLDLALADFGLSRGIETSLVFGTSSRTTAYAPPESFSGAVSRPWDWWSLGMLTLEMAVGRSPFQGMTERAVSYHLMSNTMDVGGVADPRLRLLCRGLLLRDPAARWGAEQVTRWLAGESPPVPEDVVPRDEGAVRPLPFLGERYTARGLLARAMATNWDEAARRYLVSMGTPERPSEGWRALRDWLRQFDDPEHDDVEGLQDLLDHRLTAPLPPDVKLLHLLHWLDPDLPPIYRGMAVTRESLLELALSALARPGEGGPAMGDLWGHRLLPVLAKLTGHEDLREVDERWRRLESGFGPLADRVAAGAGTRRAGGAMFDEVPVRSALLALAIDEEAASEVLRGEVRRARTAMPVPVPWFEELAASGDVLWLLAAYLSSGVARAASEGERHRLEQHEAARQAGERRWREMEAEREAGVPRALGWAGMSLLCFSVPWVLFLIPVTSPGHEWQLGVMLLIWLGVGGGEAAVATSIGSQYHPRYSLLRPLGRVAAGARGPAEVLRGLGDLASTGCGGCLVAVIAFGFLVFLVVGVAGALVQFMILPLGVAVAYAVWTYRRVHAWRGELERARRTTTGENR